MNATMKILLRSVLISIWFVVLTFPVLCVKVAARQNTVTVLWERAVGMFVVMIVCSLLWLWYPLVNAAFIIYDIALGRAVRLWVLKLRRVFMRGR